MASKALVLLGLFAFLLVVSEVAAASDTVESESEETAQPDLYGYGGLDVDNEGGSEGQGQRCRGCGPRRRCCRCIRGRCFRCCRAGEAVQTQPDTVYSGSEVTVQLDHYGHGSNGGYNESGREGQGKMDGCLHGCNHGCCSCVRGRCVRCCSYAGEAVQTQLDTVDSGSEETAQPDLYGHGSLDVDNEGGSEGQGQRCRGCGIRRCCRCIRGRCFRCCRAEEAVQTQSDIVESGSEQTAQPDLYGHGGLDVDNEGGSEGQGQICRGCGTGRRCCFCISGRCFRCCPAGEAVQTEPDTVESGNEETTQSDHYGHGGLNVDNEEGSEEQGKRCGGCGRRRCCRCIRGRCFRCCRPGEAVIASTLGIEYL